MAVSCVISQSGLEWRQGTCELTFCEGVIGSRWRGRPGEFVSERQRTRGCEDVFMSIACYALHIRHPRAHILPSLTATCQLYTVSLKAGLSTYNRFALRTLDTPDGETTQPDTHIMGVASQAPTAATARLMCELKAQGQEESHNEFDKRLAVAKQLIVRRFILKIHGDGAVFASLPGGGSHESPSSHQVSSADER